MFINISHSEGVKQEAEILFSTPFGYMFPDAAKSRRCLLPATEITLDGLRNLGEAMASVIASSGDSHIPAIFTYLGQFIDHDITARTDRDTTASALGAGEPIIPLDPDKVLEILRNGRRPQLDLDSVFGDGPNLIDKPAPADCDGAEPDPDDGLIVGSQILYRPDYTLNLFDTVSTRIDLPRQKVTDLSGKTSYPARIADMRNDENINISRLQVAIITFYNTLHGLQPGTNREKYIRARQLTRWAYQYIVVHDYLMTVCDKSIVQDTLANGPRFFSSTAGRGDAFMPLEFSTAAFRFGHTMIRPSYKLNATSGNIPLVGAPGMFHILGTNGDANNFEMADSQIKAALVIDWKNFIGTTAQRARKLDTKISHGLDMLPFRPGDPVLTNLARSNLLRGYSLSVPTGQAMCDAFGTKPMTPKQITNCEAEDIVPIIKSSYFDYRTPLWYYILREAAVQQDGERLGEIGSRIVAETLIGLLKQDPNSYLNNWQDPAVLSNGIEVDPTAGTVVSDMVDLLTTAGFAGIIKE